MNEAVRGGEPELAVNPQNPQNLLFGHTVVANNYANDSFQAGFVAYQVAFSRAPMPARHGRPTNRRR